MTTLTTQDEFNAIEAAVDYKKKVVVVTARLRGDDGVWIEYNLEQLFGLIGMLQSKYDELDEYLGRRP